MKRLLLTLLLASISYAQAGNFNVSPIRVELEPGQRAATVDVISAQKKPMVVRAELMHWTQVDGVTQLEPTSELLVTPPVFRLDAEGRQVLRIGYLGRPVPTDVEKSYRLVVQEIAGAIQDEEAPPDAAGTLHFQLDTALQIDMPVFVMVKKPFRRATATLMAAASGVVLSVRNDGNVHQRFSKLELIPRQGAPVPLKGKWFDVLPGSTAAIPLEDVTLPAGGFKALRFTEKYEQNELPF